MKNILQIVYFIKTYALKYPYFTIVYVSNYYNPFFAQKVSFYSQKEIESLIFSRKSIIRLGDGEIQLLLDRPMPYDSPVPELKENLRNIILEYTNQDKYILAIPQQLRVLNKVLSQQGTKRIWLPFKVIYHINFPKKARYMDALAFRPEFDEGLFRQVIVPFLTGKKLVFVTKKATIERLKATQMPFDEVSFVVTKEKDTFSSRDEIKSEILDKICKYDKSDVVVLFALGPTAKILVQELAKDDIQCIDLGKGMEFIFI
jgi:hypothetical protein